MLAINPQNRFGRGTRVVPTELPSWVEALPLWEWYAIPNTNLSSVPPSPTPPGILGPSAKINAWCGAALKRLGSVYILGAAGGHGDYYGNEVNAIELNTENPAWVELRASTLTADMYDATPVYADLRKSPPHTYWATQFDNANNRMLIMSNGGPFGTSGIPDAPVGWPYTPASGVLMAYDLDTGDWTPPNDLTPFPFGATATADLCTFDPVTNDIYYDKDQQGRLWKYSPSANSWTDVGPFFLNGAYAGAAIDHARGHMLTVGSFPGTRPPDVRDINTALTISPTFGGLGASVLTISNYPGVVFDEENDTFLVCSNTSPVTIYRVAAGTLVVDEPTVTGTKPAQRPNGILNSFQYVPELKGVVIANSYTGNMRFMRTAL